MKLYKFRPLGTCDDLLRLTEILNTGEFWFSSLWEQNDSLEGVYSSSLTEDRDIFQAKNQFKICSFSRVWALRQPRMWAHYANGFKGVAIEIEVEESEDIVKVEYNDHAIQVVKMDSIREKVVEIISHKTSEWKYECEYRYKKERQKSCGINIGNITAIIFGRPYGGIVNEPDVFAACDKLQNYKRLRELLQNTAEMKKLRLAEAYLQSGHGKRPKVKIRNIASPLHTSSCEQRRQSSS